MRYTLTLGILLFTCFMLQAKETQSSTLYDSIERLKNYQHLAQAQAMVVGTFHFNKSILSADKQAELQRFIKLLSQFKPTKIVLELEPSQQAFINKNYLAYLENSFDIAQKPNEVYQIGFRLAKQLKHKQLYLFDDQTEFIGSLEDFSFKAFTEYANKNDPGFYNKFEKVLTENFKFNQSLMNNLAVDEQIMLLNSPEHQKINQQRMHMYEVRVGIQKNWLGPDWLGRWYQRNVRMLGNVLKLTEPKDRILIIVGDNHKWVLDSLIEKTPDFKLVSSWEFMDKQLKNSSQ